MSGLTRYVLRQLAMGMIFVSIALTCVLWLTQSLRLIELIVTKGISVGVFLSLTLLAMPTFMVVIIPISLFAVTLFTFTKLIADRELVVMRAAGLSHWALARPAVILGCVTVAVGMFLTTWAIPTSVQTFREMQWGVRHDLSSVLLQEGAFNKFGEGLTIYVRSRAPNGELLGVLVHDRRKPEHPVTMSAERGALIFSETGPRVLLVNGSRQQVTLGTGDFSLLNFDSYTLDIDSATGQNETRFRDARERGMVELWKATESELGEIDYRRAKVEFHQRLASPIYNLGFALIALACLLPAGFDRRGQTRQVLIAVVWMVAAQAAALGTTNLATSKLIFIPLIYLAAILPVAISLWFLVQSPHTRRRRIAATTA